uniref:Uncharacterized protein n=1 Tax=Setaria digitata TaxID=48799 RepID=A0A915PSF0_9BILA
MWRRRSTYARMSNVNDPTQPLPPPAFLAGSNYSHVLLPQVTTAAADEHRRGAGGGEKRERREGAGPPPPRPLRWQALQEFFMLIPRIPPVSVQQQPPVPSRRERTVIGVAAEERTVRAARRSIASSLRVKIASVPLSMGYAIASGK